MKKVLLVLIFLATTVNIFAQTERGKILFSGTSELTYSSINTKMEYDGNSITESDVSQFNIEPTIGYFVANNLAIALNVQYESSKDDDYKSSSLMAGPAIRYYIGSSNIKPYLHADYMFGSLDEDGEKFSASGWDLAAGVAFFINKHIALDLDLGYGSVTSKYSEDEDFVITGDGLALSAGFTLVF